MRARVTATLDKRVLALLKEEAARMNTSVSHLIERSIWRAINSPEGLGVDDVDEAINRYKERKDHAD